MCEVAARAGADLVFLDLEDACAPSAKESARATAVAALTGTRLGPHRKSRPHQRDRHCRGATTTSSKSSPARATRSTSSSCRRCAPLATCGGSTCCSPSSRPSSDSIGPIAIEALIEEAEGLVNVAEIARASPRLEALIFGAGDLSASLRARVDGNFEPAGDYPGDFWHHARVQVLAAARAAGIDAIDAPYPGYQDLDGYRRAATHASLLGFDGKWAIHPSQVPVANEVFTPTAEEIAEAHAIIADYRHAEAGGVGAIGRNGRLVDAALMRHAENVLRRAHR